MAYADLHLHSNHSDGAQSPARVVERARKATMSAMALTDHDTVSGVAEARETAAQLDLPFLEGVEISTRFDKTEVHILGLGVDIENGQLLEKLSVLQSARNTRVDRIAEKLAEEGIRIDPAKVLARTAGVAAGRMHVAAELQAQGKVQSLQEGFDRFLNYGGAGYVPKEVMAIDEAIDCIHAAGGLAFVAHPGLSKNLRRILPALLEFPFDGIEAYHISHSPGRTHEFMAIAQERGVLICGGSDCHGGVKGTIEMGKVRMPLHHFETIWTRLGR
jgi:3',5'-nucleoside bisphosphate phosphatase